MQSVSKKNPAKLSDFSSNKLAYAPNALPIKTDTSFLKENVGKASSISTENSSIKLSTMSPMAEKKSITKSNSAKVSKPVKIMSHQATVSTHLVKQNKMVDSLKYSINQMKPTAIHMSSSSNNSALHSRMASTKIYKRESPEIKTGNPANIIRFASHQVTAHNVKPTIIKIDSQPHFNTDSTPIPVFTKTVFKLSAASTVKLLKSIATKNISMTKTAVENRPHSITNGQPANAKTHSETYSLKTIEPTRTIGQGKYSNSNNIREFATIPISASYNNGITNKNPANINGVSPNRMSGENFSTRLASKTNLGSGIKPRPYANFSGKKEVQSTGVHRIAKVPIQQIITDETASASAEELKQLRREFSRTVREKIARAKVFPNFRGRREFEGKPVVAFTINRSGILTKCSIVRSSGHRILDTSALESVKKAVPYPAIPDKLDDESINLKLTISYTLK
jgi:TonB family protein